MGHRWHTHGTHAIDGLAPNRAGARLASVLLTCLGMWLDVPLVLFVVGAFLLVAGRSGPGAEPPAMPRPRVREVTCGARIDIVDVSPRPNAGRRAEGISVETHDPIPIELAGWSVRIGKRRVPPDGHIVDPNQPAELPSPPLRDEGGEVELVDPCGLVTARARWGSALRHGSDLASAP